MIAQTEVELTPQETRDLVEACRTYHLEALKFNGEVISARAEIKWLKAEIVRLELKIFPVIEERACGR